MTATTYDAEANQRRARAALDRGPGHAAARLRGELAWYRECADDADRPPAERALWRQLADELAHRIEGDSPRAQPTLFGGLS